MTLAWTISAWPPVLWQAEPPPHKHFACRFVHLGTQVTSRGLGDAPCMGQTVWGSKLGGAEAGVAWDWVDLGHGVVAMADPMGFITNLQVINERGDQLPSMQVALHINEIVHELPWQAEVRLALEPLRNSNH
jgi:hypothetical protein